MLIVVVAAVVLPDLIIFPPGIVLFAYSLMCLTVMRYYDVLCERGSILFLMIKYINIIRKLIVVHDSCTTGVDKGKDILCTCNPNHDII